MLKSRPPSVASINEAVLVPYLTGSVGAEAERPTFAGGRGTPAGAVGDRGGGAYWRGGGEGLPKPKKFWNGWRCTGWGFFCWGCCCGLRPGTPPGGTAPPPGAVAATGVS